jgi:hypothetical protein
VVAKAVEAGKASCARCGLPIEPGEPWNLDHSDTDPRAYLGPSHRACNRRDGLHKQARKIVSASAPDRFGGLPDPEPDNTVTRWSRHWGGPFNPRCPACRELGKACKDAEAA